MLQDRGYKVEYSDPSLTPAIKAVDCKGDALFVILAEEPKLGVRTLRKMKEDSINGNAKHLIVICPLGLTHFAQKENLIDDSSGFVTEIFKKSELGFNVTRHELVPKYTLLTSVQKKNLLTTLRCTHSQLPKIREHDPVARYYRFTRGSVLKIERAIGTLESNIYYRIVA